MSATETAIFVTKIIDSATPVLVTGIPVLHSAVFHFRPLLADNLHYRGMKLVSSRIGAVHPSR